MIETRHLKYVVIFIQTILSFVLSRKIIKGYKIAFHSKLFRSKIPFQSKVSREEEELVKLEVKEMLKKRAIRKVQSSKGEFISNLFLVKKKDGG